MHLAIKQTRIGFADATRHWFSPKCEVSNIQFSWRYLSRTILWLSVNFPTFLQQPSNSPTLQISNSTVLVKMTLKFAIGLPPLRGPEVWNFEIPQIPLGHLWNTRGIQKVCSLIQLTTRYAHHILSLFHIVSCNWNALGPAFLQSSHSVVEEFLLLVFQPGIWHAIKIRIADTVAHRAVQRRHFGRQPVLELTCEQVRCPGSMWLLFYY